MKVMIFFFLLSLISLSNAEKVSILSDSEVYQIVNHNNKRIYPYYLVPAGNTVSLRVRGIHALEILTRKIVRPSTPIEYHYEIITEDTVHITKSARLSSESRGINGERLSTFNKHILSIDEEQMDIQIKNSSAHAFVIKFDAEKFARQLQQVEFVAFTPERYKDEQVIAIDERHFTYFSPEKSSILLTLEGPLELKIISRLLFDDSFTMQQSFRYQVYINDIKTSEYLETAIKSQKAKLQKTEEIGVSTGNVQQFRIDRGIHRIRIESPDQNRAVIFRFFINKSAIGEK